jgi:hypothetical protein
MKSQHHINDLTDDPGPNVIDLNPGDLTNDRSPFLAALAVTDPHDEPVVRHDLDLPPEEDSPHQDMPQDDQAGLSRSLCVQHPHDVEKYDIEYKMTIHHKNQHTPATLQPASWEHHPQQSYYTTNTQTHSYHYDQYATNKWQSRGQWKDYPKSSNTSNASGWIDYPKPPASHHNQYDSATKPLTAFSSDSNTTYHQPNRPSHRSGSVQSHGSANVPPGHVAINLQDGSKDE